MKAGPRTVNLRLRAMGFEWVRDVEETAPEPQEGRVRGRRRLEASAPPTHTQE